MLVRIDTALVYNDNSDNIQFDFTENQFFYVIINSTCPRQILHVLHGHPSRIRLLILNLKALRVSDSFISLGTKSHIHCHARQNLLNFS